MSGCKLITIFVLPISKEHMDYILHTKNANSCIQKLQILYLNGFIRNKTSNRIIVEITHMTHIAIFAEFLPKMASGFSCSLNQFQWLPFLDSTLKMKSILNFSFQISPITLKYAKGLPIYETHCSQVQPIDILNCIKYTCSMRTIVFNGRSNAS